MRKKIGLLGMVLLLVLTTFTVWAAGEQRVFDEAGLFSESEVIKIQNDIAQLQTRMQMDVVMVTSSEVSEGRTTAYADDYYDQGDYGTRESRSGVLFLMDMANREIYISTSGDMITVLTDAKINAILDVVYQDMASEQYGAAAGAFLSELQKTFAAGLDAGDYRMDPDTGVISPPPKTAGEIILTILIGFVAAVFAGGIPCIIIKKVYQKPGKKGWKSKPDLAYRTNARYDYGLVNDQLMNQYVTQRAIPKPPPSDQSGGHSGRTSSGSSTHTSSSGRTHGGGGRKF